MGAEVEDPARRIIFVVREGFMLHWLLYPSLRSHNLLASRHYSNIQIRIRPKHHQYHPIRSHTGASCLCLTSVSIFHRIDGRIITSMIHTLLGCGTHVSQTSLLHLATKL